MINCVQAFNGFGFGDAGFQMSFGIGAFPFGLFASVFNINDGRPSARMYCDFIDTSVHFFLALAICNLICVHSDMTCSLDS